MPGGDPELLLGPLLRRVEERRATVWVQTDRPCDVEVTAGPGGGRQRTFTAFGSHYALVLVTGLVPGSEVPYQVHLDGISVWPPEESRFPPSRIRTLGGDRPVRLVFGSCRQATPYTTGGYAPPPDAADAYALRLSRDQAPWPDYLVLLGDQVYADETSQDTRRFLRRRRRRDPGGPEKEVKNFSEYTRLYLESWSDPEFRWLLSTVPSLMIFDDHEVIDDWNTSEAWRRMIKQKPWWQERITGGLASYWVYQHLGNLSPDELASDPLLEAVHRATDASEVLTEFARRADGEADGAPGPRWSFRLDIGRSRIVMLDTRCSRVLAEHQRDMLPESEWRWLIEQLPGDYDHLVVGSSLPWLLPAAVHDVEAASEKLCRSRLPLVAAVTERVRQTADLEHWAAFRTSFRRFAGLLTDVATGRFTPVPPATVTVLSGDVHHTYLARVERDGRPGGDIYQVTSSPIHNQAPHALKVGFQIGWSGVAQKAGAVLSRLHRSRPSSLRWRKLTGPYFQNSLGLLRHRGRAARLSLYAAARLPDGDPGLLTLDQVPLASDDPAPSRPARVGTTSSRR